MREFEITFYTKLVNEKLDFMTFKTIVNGESKEKVLEYMKEEIASNGYASLTRYRKNYKVKAEDILTLQVKEINKRKNS